MMDPNAFRVEALLSMQRALWDLVTPGLRAVAVRVESNMIIARFLFEAVGDPELQVAAEAETYVLADFHPPVDVCFSATAVPATVTRELKEGEEWVYRRAEGES